MSLTDDALDVQVELLRYFASDIGARYFQSEFDEAIGPLFPDDATDEERNIDAGRLLRAWLRDANCYAISADIVEVLDVCHHNVPPYELAMHDLPTAAGFVWMERPVLVHDDTPERKPIVIRAFSWVTLWDRAGRPGVLLVGFTEPADERDHGHADLTDSVSGDLARLVGLYPPRGLWSMISGVWMMGQDAHHQETFRLFSTFLRFIGEPWVNEAPGATSRHARRRAAREGAQSVVNVVRLRRKASTAGGAHEGTGREWAHRWMVGLPHGRWRNQWYPSKGVHRPKLIVPYEKGPADKPLLVKETVFRVDR